MKQYMKRTLVQPLVLLSLLAAWSNCQRLSPDVVQPQPVPQPPVLIVDKWKQDPASLMEGAYTGDLFTRTITQIGILGHAQLLLKRIDTHRIKVYSIYGRMNTYEVDLMVSHDTIKAVLGQQIALDLVVRDNKPVDFHVEGTLKILFNEEQPDMVFFNWIKATEFRPLSLYRSSADVQPSLDVLTGTYYGQHPVRVSDERRFLIFSKAIVVKQIGRYEIEVSDINRWQKPIRLPLRKSESDSTWSGETDALKIAFTIKGGQPQRLVIQPTIADTVGIEAWPPLNFEYNTQKPSYYSTYIRL